MCLMQREGGEREVEADKTAKIKKSRHLLITCYPFYDWVLRNFYFPRLLRVYTIAINYDCT